VRHDKPLSLVVLYVWCVYDALVYLVLRNLI